MSLTEYKDFNEGGQASAFSFTDYKADGSFNARRDFSKEYTPRDSFLEKKVIGTGVASSGSISPGNTFIDYDLQGRKTLIQDQNNVNLSDISARRMLYAADGTLLRKEDGKMSTLNVPSSFTRDAYSLHITSNGNYLGEVARTKKVNDNTPVRFTDTLMAQHGAGMSQSEGSGVQSYQTQGGDTLASIALAFYGSSDYWYLIANRNGLSSTREAPIAAGQTLEVPSRATQVNSANSFKPMQLEQIIGDTTPGLPQLPPPPKCNAIAMIVMIAITVVATIATAGAAALADPGAVMSTGMSALAGGLGWAGAGAAAAGGFVGSVAGQLAGKAMGVVESFSLRNAFASAFTAGATAGMGHLMGVGGQAAGKFTEIAKEGAKATLDTYGKMAMAASSVGFNVAANKLAGNNNVSFSWRNVVTSAATAGAMDYLGITDTQSSWGKATNELGFTADVLNGFAGAAVGYGVGKALYNKGGWNFRDVATDVFGNALGNAVVASMMPATTQQAEKKADAAASQAKAQGASPEEVHAIRLETYARERGGVVEPVTTTADGRSSSVTLHGEEHTGFRLSNGKDAALIDYSANLDAVSDFLGDSPARDLAKQYAASRIAAKQAIDAALIQGLVRGETRYNYLNRDSIAAQQRQRDTARQLDAMNHQTWVDRTRKTEIMPLVYIGAVMHGTWEGGSSLINTVGTFIGEEVAAWQIYGFDKTKTASAGASVGRIIDNVGKFIGEELFTWDSAGFDNTRSAAAGRKTLNYVKNGLMPDIQAAGTVVKGVASSILDTDYIGYYSELTAGLDSVEVVHDVFSFGTETVVDVVAGARAAKFLGWVGSKLDVPVPIPSLGRTNRADVATNNVFNSKADPILNSMGDARVTHVDEFNSIKADLDARGVRLKIGESDGINFDSDGMAVNLPENFSISALRHEYGHVVDHQALGSPSFISYFEYPQLRLATERRQYLGEIKFAKEIGDTNGRRQLIQNYLTEKNQIIDNTYPLNSSGVPIYGGKYNPNPFGGRQ